MPLCGRTGLQTVPLHPWSHISLVRSWSITPLLTTSSIYERGLVCLHERGRRGGMVACNKGTDQRD
jgi:hypothetical protein